MAGFEGVAMIDGFIAHVLAQDTSISGETRHSHTNVVVDLEHLLLVAGKVTGKALEAAQHDVGIRANAKTDTALLDGFHGVLDLEELALW